MLEKGVATAPFHVQTLAESLIPFVADARKNSFADWGSCLSRSKKTQSCKSSYHISGALLWTLWLTIANMAAILMARPR